MPAEIDVRPVQHRDVRTAGRVLARAFFDDPVMTWMVPDSGTRAMGLRRGFTTLGRLHFLPRGGSEVATREGEIGGATMWDPPGQRKSSRLEQLLMMPGMLWAFGRRAPAMEQLMELMEDNHPEEPHWYLMIIGTDPTVRGAGFGQALMNSRLQRCDDEHAPAYLEATKPELPAYYMRFGFEVTGEIQLPNGGPSMWPMWRAAR